MSILRQSEEWGWWLPDLDAAIGPIVSGRTYLIAGRPSCGKTLLMQNLLYQLLLQANGTPTFLMAWTERGEEPAMISMASLMHQLNEDLCLRKKWELLPAGAEEKIERSVLMFQNNPDMFPVIDKACPTSEDIRLALEQWRPTFFFFDYLQNVMPLPGQTDWGGIMAAMGHCVEYAKNGGTVFIGSQLKRLSDGPFDKYRPPHIDSFLGGGKIEASANVALGLYRPLRALSRDEEKEVRIGLRDLEEWKIPGVMCIKVLKHTYIPNAPDRIVRVRVQDDRRLVDYNYREPEYDRGDAWEAPF